MNEMDFNSKQFSVVINSDFELMLTCALRYAVGRKTYITRICSHYILSLVPKLSNKCLDTINRDFERYDKDDNDWGMDCDKVEWFKLWNAVKDELKKRGL